MLKTPHINALNVVAPLFTSSNKRDMAILGTANRAPGKQLVSGGLIQKIERKSYTVRSCGEKITQK